MTALDNSQHSSPAVDLKKTCSDGPQGRSQDSGLNPMVVSKERRVLPSGNLEQSRQDCKTGLSHCTEVVSLFPVPRWKEPGLRPDIYPSGLLRVALEVGAGRTEQPPSRPHSCFRDFFQMCVFPAAWCICCLANNYMMNMYLKSVG